MTKKKDLLNQKFGKLTVIQEANPINNRSAWLCLCSCGNKKVIKAKYLLNNNTKSCGCSQGNKKHLPKISSALSIFKKRYSDGDLTFETFLELSSKNCHYCDSPPKNKYNVARYNSGSEKSLKTGTFIYNGLDRVDNSLPHNKNNVVPCCRICNKMKINHSLQDFISQIKKIYEFYIKN